jgi:hypothetical protein
MPPDRVFPDGAEIARFGRFAADLPQNLLPLRCWQHGCHGAKIAETNPLDENISVRDEDNFDCLRNPRNCTDSLLEGK